MFDTNVGQDVFTKLQRALEKYKGWERVEVEEYDVYYGENNLRTTVYPDGTQNSIIKKSLEKIDYVTDRLPLDVRMGISKESPVDVPDEMEYTASKHKVRTSYYRKNLRIDMTAVTGDPDDKDAEEAEEFQVELEIVNLKLVKSMQDFYSHVYKIKNLLDCL